MKRKAAIMFVGTWLLFWTLIGMALLITASSVRAHGSDTGHEHGVGHNDQTDDQVGSTDEGSPNSDHGNHAGGTAGVDFVADIQSSGQVRARQNASANTGDATATNGGNVISVAGDQYREAANTASAVLARQCQTGISAQTGRGGVSVVYSDQLCDYYRAAQAALVAYNLEMEKPRRCVKITCSVTCPVENYVAAEMDDCPPTEQAQAYLNAYHDSMAMAHNLLVRSEGTAQLDRWWSHLWKPMLFFLALFGV